MIMYDDTTHIKMKRVQTNSSSATVIHFFIAYSMGITLCEYAFGHVEFINCVCHLHSIALHPIALHYILHCIVLNAINAM